MALNSPAPHGDSLLSRFEVEILCCVAAGDSGRFRRLDLVLAEVAEKLGVLPRHALETILNNGDRNLVHLRSFELLGPWRQPWRVDLKTIEVGSTPTGRHLAESMLDSSMPRIPVGLANGSIYGGGSRPPFNPTRVMDACEVLATDPGATTEQIATLMGRPTGPFGAPLAEPLSTLHGDGAAQLTLEPRWEVSPTGTIEITAMPYTFAAEDLVTALESQLGTSASSVVLSPAGDYFGISVVPSPGTDPLALGRKAAADWPLRRTMNVTMLPSPAEALRTWCSEGPVIHRSDLTRLLATQ